MQVDKLHGKFLLNFLAKNEKNVADIMEAGSGYIVPSISSHQFNSIDDAIESVKSFKKVPNTVSIGLGDGGNAHNWGKALSIAAGSNVGHVNQPFEKAAYAKGFFG